MNSKHTLWVERYRPDELKDYVGNEGLKAFISKCIDSNDIPHLILWGKAGTGKTTLAKLVTKNIKCDVMYINASDERGIDTIRDKIVDFASVNSFNPIKVIILDESDYITPQAQAALRNVMETYSAKTRFILTANYAERIIDPLKSRCQTFHIEPPSKGDIAKHIAGLLDNEEVQYELTDVAALIKTYYPDIRKIINAAQQSVDSNNILNPGALIPNVEGALTAIINALKSNDKNAWTNIRQLIADAEVNDFVPLYTGLYERATEYTKSPADVAIHSAQHLWQNNTIADKEINFMAFISQILKTK
jgi:DNA polymerase III delta prime subunit